MAISLKGLLQSVNICFKIPAPASDEKIGNTGTHLDIVSENRFDNTIFTQLGGLLEFVKHGETSCLFVFEVSTGALENVLDTNVEWRVSIMPCGYVPLSGLRSIDGIMRVKDLLSCSSDGPEVMSLLRHLITRPLAS